MADKQPGNLIPDIYGVSQPNPGQQSFVPQTQFGNAPDYTGYSKGTRPVQADTSKGTALENIGKGVTDASEVTKNVYKNKVEDALNTGIDKARADQNDRIDQAFSQLQNGPDVYAQGQGKTPPRVPVGVTRFGDAISTAQEQYDQGTLTNSMYHGQLEQLVSQVKAAYPGFTDEVDQMIKDKTGIIPAEALRKDRLADLNALERAKAGAASKDEAYFQANAKYLGVDAGTITNRVRTDPSYLPRAITLIHQAQGLEFAMESAKNKTAYDSTQAQGEFQSYANTYVRQSLGRQSAATGLSYNDIQTAVTKLRASGETPDTKTIMQWVNAATVARNADEAALRQKLTDPNGQGVSWARSIGDENKAESIIKSALTQRDSQLNDLIAGNHDIAHLNKIYNESYDDQLTRRIVGEFPVMGPMKVLKDRGGDFLVQAGLADGTGKQLQQVTTQVNGALLYNSIYNPSATMPEDHAKAKGLASTDAEKSEFINTSYSSHMAMITTKDGDPDKKARVIHWMFSNPEGLNRDWNEGVPRQTWFNRLSSQNMVEAVKEVARSHPEAWQEYSHFMSQNFAGIIHQNVSELNNQVTGGQTQFKYDPDLNMVIARTPDRNNPDRLTTSPPRVQAILTPLNTTLSNMSRVLKENKADIGVEIQKSLAGQGAVLGDWTSTAKPGREQLKPVGSFIKRLFTGPPEEEEKK